MLEIISTKSMLSIVCAVHTGTLNVLRRIYQGVLSKVIQLLLCFVGWKRFDLTAKDFVLYEIRKVGMHEVDFLLENNINPLSFEQKYK
jgi:hypothetical protein